MMTYLTEDEIKPGVLLKVRSYHTAKTIPAVVICREATGSGVSYVRAVDSEGESFLANPDFLEAWSCNGKQ